MIESATGLVLRVRPFTETSLIVNWATQECGRITTIAKGARRAKSPYTGKLDLFFLAKLSFSRSRQSELHTLREVTLLETHRRLREDLALVQQASYCTALVEAATETETPIPAVFELLRSVLAFMVAKPHQPHTIFAFELKLLENLGLQPDPEATRLSSGSRQILKLLSLGDWERVAQVRLSPQQVTEVGRFLYGFLAFHLGSVPRTRAAAVHA